ncbi:GNAT family N-acetyltransferase [Pelagibius sp. Alg239-R121]|uniref:GNAT family N-acetyltransferase n=1 Tax=Pelagibius sp. Alg239-R121 TaxID=2993448 RepID=UPI0024A753CF|nr:GNAT family N-acetyltransferase [Pelagibius sp. Alg239-R121]
MSEKTIKQDTTLAVPQHRSRIRDLTLSDAALSSALHSACFQDEPWHTEAFADLLAMPGTFGFLSYETDLPLGIILCRAVADECEVLTFCVIGSARRGGIGSDLLIAGLHRATGLGVRDVFLEVAVDNMAAIRLYQRMGFAQTAVRPNYYRRDNPLRRVDAVVMSKPLDDQFGTKS